MNRYRRTAIAQALRTVPLDRLESRHDYLTRVLDQGQDGDHGHLEAEHAAITAEIRRRHRPAEIARAIRNERYHPDHYQPTEQRRKRRRGRKRRRCFDRKLLH